ncbi:hypothetical protein AAFX33_13480 [Vibrio chagasii]|uniref:hypothetical protein n=1 Tax=Vibrio chagasii TaxID=170679 RepID=UPI0038CD85ED
MKKSKTFNLKEIWASGKFSLWKISLALTTLLLFSPWLKLIGYEFTIESKLAHPSRSLHVYVNNGVFTFVNILSDGTTRKSSGLIGFTNNSFYFLIFESKYLHVDDHLSPDLKRDLINANNHFFNVRLKTQDGANILMSFDEELQFEDVQDQLAQITGHYPEID